jgi:putative FmdB family regulatory protein
VGIDLAERQVMRAWADQGREPFEGPPMPIYEYHCSHCETQFEKLVRSDTVVACPQCGAHDVNKCVSAPTPPGLSKGIIQRARARAAAEGELSNFSKAERNKF